MTILVLIYFLHPHSNLLPETPLFVSIKQFYHKIIVTYKEIEYFCP